MQELNGKISKSQMAAIVMVNAAANDLRRKRQYRDLRYRILDMFTNEHHVPRAIAQQVHAEDGPWGKLRIEGIRNAISLFLRRTLKDRYPEYKKASFGRSMHDRGSKPTREQLESAHRALGHRPLWTPEQTAFLSRLLLDPLFRNRNSKHARIAGIMTAAFPDAQPFTPDQCADRASSRLMKHSLGHGNGDGNGQEH